MMDESLVQKFKTQARHRAPAQSGDEDLGPLSLLPGKWANLPTLPGRGWNLIALPFATPSGGGFNYRVLMNQYNEELQFSLVDKGVPNRGIRRDPATGTTSEADQLVVTLDYEQKIDQVAADDFPRSGKAGAAGLAIHHEPGLWLHMLNEQTDGLDIGRLASIPHGNSVLALGRSSTTAGAPQIPASVSALPIGVSQDLQNNPYLEPYQHFVDQPFKGTVTGAGFPGFLPTDTSALLTAANAGVSIKRTTTLHVDTEVESGGIVNIPFIERQADAASMNSTFWIQELEDTDEDGNARLRLQYLQVVILDFFPRRDGLPGLIRWPHISINTMERVSD
ncbi:MAG: heme-binding protein [Planctomycetaceae bacterium]|nr:heme-binding protein [Planctomycetaceae bacterium]